MREVSVSLGLPSMPRAAVPVRRRFAIVVLLLACLAGVAVAASGAGTALERSLHSMRDALRQHDASGHYVLVEIDARSLDHFDRWPWPRRLYAQAIAMLERAGADTIAFDVDVSAYSTPEQDRALASAIDRAKVPIILPTFQQHESLSSGKIFENVPIPMLRRNAQIA